LYGATVPLWALIPRVIWPDKPTVGGGQDWVSQFTGITFDESTSIGIGQVLELYMNFGISGIIVGFAVLGFILMRLDQGIMGALAMRHMHRVIKLTMPGLALLAPMGSAMEVLVTVVSAIITSHLLVRSRFLVLPPIRQPSAKISAQTMRAIEPR
jgi:hypothetical protein